MSLEYIRNYYGVNAKKGGKVRDPKGQIGTITGSNNAHVMVRIEGIKHSVPYHPTDLEYLEKS